jgi:AcrR family transcriptional regulator
MSKLRGKREIRPRDRLLEAAYKLFATHGVSQVGIDTILANSGCAKASLYTNFGSKIDLAVAFLDRREALWTRAWFETEIKRRASDPDACLLAMFDVFDGWFRKEDFEGCSFIKVLLESKVNSRLHRAAANHLSNIRAIIQGLAQQANLAEPERFARTWQTLLKGSIVSAWEGDRNAAREAKYAARLLLHHWKRRKISHAQADAVGAANPCR